MDNPGMMSGHEPTYHAVLYYAYTSIKWELSLLWISTDRS